MKAILRIFSIMPLRTDEIANAVFSVANTLGPDETTINLFPENANASVPKRTTLLEATHGVICSEIRSAGSIAGIFKSATLTGEFSLGNASIESQHLYCPVCDVRLSGDIESEVIDKLEKTAVAVLENISWDYGFITYASFDAGVLHYPFGYSIGIPRVFWSNYLGEKYSNLINVPRLRQNEFRITAVPHGNRMTLPCRPSEAGPNSGLGAKLIDALVSNIGPEFFVRKERWYKMPVFSRIFPALFGRIVGASNRPNWK